MPDDDLGRIASRAAWVCEPLRPFLARRGESLGNHCAAVATISAGLATSAVLPPLPGLGTRSVGAALSAIAGIIHDIGKALPSYQGSIDEGPPIIRHEVASFVAAANAIRVRDRRWIDAIAPVMGSVLYHHHGMYDITERISHYLVTGARAWETESSEGLEEAADALSSLFKRLRVFVHEFGLSNMIFVSEEAVSAEAWSRPLRDLIRAGALEQAFRLEEEVNRRRHVVVPMLSNVMIADNVAAYCATRYGGGADEESGRITFITRVGLPVIVSRVPAIAEAVSAVDTLNHVLPCLLDLVLR